MAAVIAYGVAVKSSLIVKAGFWGGVLVVILISYLYYAEIKFVIEFSG
jgi:hypothetical protein